MPAQPAIAESSGYVSQLFALIRLSAVQLVRPPSAARRTQAARRLLRQASVLLAVGAVAIVVPMFAMDTPAIGMMPPRGAASLWPFRVLTDLGKDEYVLVSLTTAMIVVAIVYPRLKGTSRTRLAGFGTRLQFLFFAVLVPVLSGEIIKYAVGRGRPFVGGKANAFNFAPFTGTEAYLSFPSGHAVASFALAFAVGAIWPRARFAMAVYAILIAITRLVLLAHHPSDVVAGAVLGVAGAMLVRYWFAVRRLGFSVGRGGEIVPV
jgi:undecaprenyl-diphosphatase